jgi:hypothetical protein
MELARSAAQACNGPTMPWRSDVPVRFVTRRDVIGAVR